MSAAEVRSNSSVRPKRRASRSPARPLPHHLFLTEDDYNRGGNRFDMRPKLASPDDVAALWENLDVIDIFATDHAPHTFSEKGMPRRSGSDEEGDVRDPTVVSDSSLPGVPGVETMLPLLLTAVDAGQLELDDLLLRCVENPRRIYSLEEQPQTWIEVDIDKVYELDDAGMRTRCGWTPFAGRHVKGRVDKVVLRVKPSLMVNGSWLRQEAGVYFSKSLNSVSGKPVQLEFLRSRPGRQNEFRRRRYLF